MKRKGYLLASGGVGILGIALMLFSVGPADADGGDPNYHIEFAGPGEICEVTATPPDPQNPRQRTVCSLVAAEKIGNRYLCTYQC